MRVIPPLEITAAMLTSSTLVETTPAAYNAGTAYALGDLVYVGTVGQALTVYRSLQNANTGNTPASSPAWWEEVNDVYAEYAGGTTYALGDIVQVAATHLVYESLVAGNLGNAVTDTTKWQEVGPTNKWAMFDVLRNTQSTAPEGITVVITPGERIDSIALVGVDAQTVTITMTDAGGGTTYYTHTEDMTTRDVAGWYDYFFTPFEIKPTLVLFDLPPYSGAKLTVELTRTGGQVSCGGIVIGSNQYIGDVLHDGESDALNFSTVTRDEFGTATLVQRRSIPKVNVTAVVDKTYVTAIYNLRKALNAKPAFWALLEDAGDGYFEAFAILGFYRRFTINAALPEQAIVSLELEEI